MRKPKVGEPVIFYGLTLAIVALSKSKDGTRDLAVCADPLIHKERETLRAKVKKLRAEQAKESAKAQKLLAEAVEGGDEPPGNTERWHEIRREIENIDKGFRGKYSDFRLRTEFFSYWEEREVWTVHGRTLSDAQYDAFKDAMKVAPHPAKHREALLFLEANTGGGA
jgi:hypothetical protein